MKISKQEWENLGGFRNPRLWRKQAPNGRWYYYKEPDADWWFEKDRKK